MPAPDRLRISPTARAALDELVARDDPTILGLVLSGSAARGMETERSDVDVFVVRDDDVDRETRRTCAVVDREVRAWDAAHGTTVCADLVDGWADELAVLRG